MKANATILCAVMGDRRTRPTRAWGKAALAVGGLVLATGTSVLASALYSIGVLNPDMPYSAVYAVSQEGTFAVGESTSAGAYSGGSPWPADPGTNAAVVWSLQSGLVELPCPSKKNTYAHGVTVGISNNLGNIIISGLHEGYLTHRYYKAPLTNLAGGVWADSGNAGGLGLSNMRGGMYNDLRSHPGHDGRWYTGGYKNNDGRVCRLRGDPFIGWDGSFNFRGNSVSAYGVVVGRYTGESPSTARWDSPIPGESGIVPGSQFLYRADGHGISSGFGISLTENYDVQWICGQVQSYAGGNFEAFRWKRGDESMTFLGALPDAYSSTAYSIANNGVTVGRSYFLGDPSYEMATVWDTSGTWDTSGQAKSLKELLEADGVDTSAWLRLSRATAVSDDGTVIGGFGIWAADGSTRGFVAVKSAVTAPVVQITHTEVSGSSVTIHFTSSNPSDTPASFVVQSSGAVGGPYTDASALITGSSGSYQAVLTTDGTTRFYRIRRPL